MDKPLVSVITPVLNGFPYMEECWMSLKDQEWERWEWLIIDNGSQDGSAEKMRELASSDQRIRTFDQQLPSAGMARNVGLDHAKGDYICFLDIDDVLPPRSLSSRALFLEKKPAVDVVDGRVEVMGSDMATCERVWIPGFRGDVFPELLKLNPAAFFGLTWMIRASRIGEKRFSRFLSHCEDLHFFLSLGDVTSDFVSDTVLRYRTGHVSVMSDLNGLEDGYRKLAAWTQDQDAIDQQQSEAFRKKVRRIVFRSWLKAGKPLSAVKSYLKDW